MGDFTWLDAVGCADLVRSGQASPSELVEAAIDRIERTDPAINAVIHPRFDKARREAAGALPAGPFTGVPMVVKDLVCMTEGDPYHAGTRLLKNLGYIADHDTYLATKFRQAGFVIVGRTSTPELGSTITTEPLAYGPCRNPWNTDHSTGGSSGGSAASVAAAMVPVGHANDGGGSIRIPASECGLVGLKPSRGRVSQGPDSGESWNGATIEGVVTRSVRDAAAVLDAIAGYMPGDPYTAPLPARPFAAEVGAPVERLRIGLLDHPVGGAGDVSNDGHPECAAAVVGAGKLLESLGHHVEVDHPTAMADGAFGEHFLRIVASWCAVDLDTYEALAGRPLTDDDIEPLNLMMRHLGRKVAAPDYLASEVWMHAYTRRMLSWWHPADGSTGFDLLVSPVLGAPPPPIGWLSDPEHGGNRLRDLLRYTAQFNCTGQPAISLPLHWSADGLPVGVQVVAAYGREDVLLRLAAQLEQAAPWAARRPLVHA